MGLLAGSLSRMDAVKLANNYTSRERNGGLSYYIEGKSGAMGATMVLLALLRTFAQLCGMSFLRHLRAVADAWIVFLEGASADHFFFFANISESGIPYHRHDRVQ